MEVQSFFSEDRPKTVACGVLSAKAPLATNAGMRYGLVRKRVRIRHADPRQPAHFNAGNAASGNGQNDGLCNGRTWHSAAARARFAASWSTRLFGASCRTLAMMGDFRPHMWRRVFHGGAASCASSWACLSRQRRRTARYLRLSTCTAFMCNGERPVRREDTAELRASLGFAGSVADCRRLAQRSCQLLPQHGRS